MKKLISIKELPKKINTLYHHYLRVFVYYKDKVKKLFKPRFYSTIRKVRVFITTAFSATKAILKHWVLISLVLIFVIVLHFLDWLFSLIVAAAILIFALFEIRRECEEDSTSKIRLATLFFLSFTVTLISLQDWVYPIIIRTESISTKNIIGFEEGADNIAFKTVLKIEEPVDLKIQNSYINLTLQTDYVCVDDFVYINYLFGNKKELNYEIGERRGLVFTYKGRALIFSDEWWKYRNGLQNTKRLKEMKETQVKK